MRTKLRTFGAALKAFDARAVKPQPKTADPIYQTPQYEAWRTSVIARAGGQCQAVDRGVRCNKAQPDHRMFADHIIELRDGGAPFDPANGQCLCGSHHTLKTTQARASRLGSKSK